MSPRHAPSCRLRYRYRGYLYRDYVNVQGGVRAEEGEDEVLDATAFRTNHMHKAKTKHTFSEGSTSSGSGGSYV